MNVPPRSGKLDFGKNWPLADRPLPGQNYAKRPFVHRRKRWQDTTQKRTLRHRSRGYFAPAGTLALQVGWVYHWLRNMIAVSLRGNDLMRYIIGLVVTIVVIVIVLRVLGVI